MSTPDAARRWHDRVVDRPAIRSLTADGALALALTAVALAGTDQAGTWQGVRTSG
jgi:hypothetical protein